MASDGYRKKLKQLGYKITSTNYDTSDYLEYEVVKGDQTWEVQIDVDEDTGKATEIDIAQNVWKTDETTAAVQQGQDLSRTAATGTGVVSGDTARRTRNMRNNQYSDRDRSTTDQLVRELDNLPVGRSKEFYKNTLRQRGYEITKVNKDDSDEMSVEAVKNGNSVQLDISFDENTAQSTEIDASTLWAESESTTRTREAQERTLDSRSSSGRTPDMNRDDDRRTDAGTDDGQALLGSGKMAKEDRTGSTGPSGTRSTSIPNTGAVDTAGRVTKPAGDEAVTEVDRGLASGIRSSLLGHPDLLAGSGENVHLIVNNGFVTIQGWVPSEQNRRAIADRIQEHAGVQGIDNQLLVRSETSLENRR
jgi:osmotically-inducible protein OsmY/uncharacterized protein YmfQ (DUF2313 family)